MMRFLILFACVVGTVHAQTNDVVKVRVTGDRVSLRSAPDIEGYLLDSSMRGEEMIYYGESNGWLAVQAPDSIDYWVAADYVKDGVVQPKKLNIRCGPSQNYAVVAVVERDDKLSLRGEEFNGWLKIAPPVGSMVWISADYAEIIVPPKPTPEPEPVPVVETPEPEAEPVPVITGKTKLNPEDQPLVLVTDETREQGRSSEIAGVLRRANPGLYKLVLIEGGLEETICLVRGRQSQMERYLNRSMLLKGPVYWARNVNLPIIQPETIHLDPIVSH